MLNMGPSTFPIVAMALYGDPGELSGRLHVPRDTGHAELGNRVWSGRQTV